METNPSPLHPSPPPTSSPSLSENELDLISESPDVNGLLCLKGNPGLWIQFNPHPSHLLVKHLVLDFSGTEDDEEHKIEDSIDQLTLLTHLTILRANGSLNCFPDSIATLHNLQFLKFDYCDFKELPANIGLLKNNLTHLTIFRCYRIKFLPETVSTFSNLTSLHLNTCYPLAKLPACLSQLRSLTHLILQQCNIKFFPDNIATLSNLTFLHFSGDHSLTELPASLGELQRLEHFYLENCYGLRSLPNTMANLLHLETLSIKGCHSLKELPDNLEVTSLQIIDSDIKFFPRGMISLRHLQVTPYFAPGVFPYAYLRDPVNLHDFTNLDELVNLQTLSFRLAYGDIIVKFPDNLEGLDELILLDIQDTTVKYLPWSILKLPKLRILMLPWEFRLETLPFHLNDSVLVSVKGRHFRKTWKQLKQEIGIAFPTAQGEYPPIISPPGYLSFHGDLGQWIKDNYESRLLVNMLELQLPMYYDVHSVKKSIRELRNLSRLFVSNGEKKICFPNTMKGIEHLCLQWYDYKSHPVNLHQLSDLKTLDLIISSLPSEPSFPVSLTHLSLNSPGTFSLPASMSQLSNLHTLELSRCRKLSSLPPLNIVTLKIDRIIQSFPICLRHLEILHVKRDCFGESCDRNRLEHCLAQLVDLEMLSLTCYHIKSLPSMARQCNLQVLLLKDCFALEELLPDMEHLVKLHTLDISGTRIKYLPDSIVKLTKLQQLTLPKCFTQKLPRKLEEVSIIDDTHKRYYEHMGYYDSDLETISNSSEGTDDEEVGYTEDVDEAITDDLIQGIVDEHTCEHNDVIAQVPTVLRSTMKRGMNEHGIIWPSSKKLKQRHNAEDGEPNTYSTYLEKPSKPADGHEHMVSKAAAATMETVEKPPLDYVKESHMEVPQHAEVHLDGVNQSNIAYSNGSSSSFDFVKACYEGETVWIDFSLSSSFDQLNESICKKFRLEVEKFKIRYLDEDKEWLLMTCIADLTHALLHTSSSGKKFVRLSIIGTRFVNIGRASEKDNGQITPKTSEGWSTLVYMHSEREKLNIVQCAGEISNQPSNRDCIPFSEFCVPHIKPLIEGYKDVKADGNCGFRVIATFEYGDEEKWLDVRIDLLTELTANKELYERALGGDEEFERAHFMLNWLLSPAVKMHWFEATCLGLVVATKYQKVFTCWSTECCTYLPLVSRLVDHKPPTMYINMARINGNHFIALQMPTNSPLPPLSPLWKRHRCDIVKHWSTSIFEKQLDDYLQLCD